MTTQFRAKLDPSRVHIKWRMITTEVDSHGSPEEEDEGFWPSSDPNAAGYVEPSKFKEEMEKAKARMAAYERGEWFYCGVIARADILIPIGGQSFRMLRLESSGLWGIESDSGEYLREVYDEQKDELKEQLRAFADCIISGKVSETE